MSKKWSNLDLPGALHFVTGNVHRRRPIFRSQNARLAFLNELQALRANRECKLIAFVIMPDHFHIILNPAAGSIQNSTRRLKSLSAKSLVELAPQKWFWNGRENQVWQESFKALPLWSGWMIRQKINYIHSNPIRAKLVETTEEYRWSSFHAFYREEADPVLQVDQDWWWPDDVDKLRIAMGELTKEWEAKWVENKKKARVRPPS